MTNCPICGALIDEESVPTAEFRGTKYYFHESERIPTFGGEANKSAAPHRDEGTQR